MGFTLIELSIVLVIIGLIVGGVLVGQDLINSSRIRAQIKQFEDYKLALNNFKLKYNCLPGDCASATAFGFTGNGDGDGVLEMSSIAASVYNCSWIDDNSYTTPDCNFNGEFPLFFQHLSAAKMIAGSFDGTWVLGKGYPTVTINESKGMIAAGAWHGGSADTIPDYLKDTYNFPAGFWLHVQFCGRTADLGPAWANDDCGVLTPLQTRQIDIKIDDGKPLSGHFWGYTGDYDVSIRPSLCLNGGNTDYTRTNDIVCHASYKMY